MAKYGIVYLSFPFLLFHFNQFIRFGHNSFQEASKISNRVPENEIDWANFKYMVFDIPNHQGTYEERYNLLGIFKSFFIYSPANNINSGQAGNLFTRIC